MVFTDLKKFLQTRIAVLGDLVYNTITVDKK